MPLNLFFVSTLLLLNASVIKSTDAQIATLFLQDPVKNASVIKSAENYELELVLKEILLSELAKSNNLSLARALFKEFESSFEQAVKRSVNLSTDPEFFFYFKDLGYNIERAEFEKNRVNKKSFSGMSFFIDKYPVHDYSKELFFLAKDSLRQETLEKFLLANMNDKNIEKYLNAVEKNPQASFIRSIVRGDTSEIKDKIDSNANLFRKTGKKTRIKYSHFLNDSAKTKSDLYYIGRNHEDLKNIYDALECYVKAEDEEAVLRVAALMKNQSKQSILADSVILHYPCTSDAFLYHKAKLLMRMNREDEGEVILSSLSEKFPDNLYSIRSFLYLGKSFDSFGLGYEPDSALLYLFAEFKKTGKEQFFNRLVFRLTESGSMSRIDAAVLMDSLKIHNLAIYFAETAKRAKMTGDLIKILYPVPYLDLFRAASVKYNLDLSLLLALAREESSFNPAAVSSAGAKGLMQLMDFTYDEYYKDKDNFNIEKNIDAGAHHLSVYMKDFPDNPAEGIMSYNAGKGNVKKWKRLYADWELHLESVPFIETKNYVKRVLRSFFVYKFIIKVS